jgi:hypothetical protein
MGFLLSSKNYDLDHHRSTIIIKLYQNFIQHHRRSSRFGLNQVLHVTSQGHRPVSLNLYAGGSLTKHPLDLPLSLYHSLHLFQNLLRTLFGFTQMPKSRIPSQSR